MKKFISLIVLFLLLSNSNTTQAQYRPIRFGFHASPSLTWLKPSTEGYRGDGLKFGFSWGLDAEFFLMENYAIQSGFKVLFLNGGLEYPHQMDINGNEEVVPGKLERHYKFQYIQIPLAMKMMTKEFGRYRFFGKIGLGTAFRLKAKSENTFRADNGQKESYDKDLNKETKLIRESLLLGIGTEYNIGGSTRLIFGITFDNAFIDVLKDQNTLKPELENSAINNALEFKLGLIF